MANEEQAPYPRPGFYYVSAIDGPRSARVRGPFTTHAEALALVATSRDALVAMDPRAHFYAFGTCRSESNLGPGYLDTIARRWQCLTCTREGSGAPPSHCPGCTSEHDANHGPHAIGGQS